MALAKGALESALKGIFAAMGEGKKTDAWLAGQMASAIKTYILAGQVTTADAGAGPGGSYTGAGTGTMTIDSSALESALSAAFEECKDNGSLAEQMASGIDAACSANGTVATSSAGTLATAGGASPFAGAGKGAFSGAKALIAAALAACFAAMDKMTAGGDDYLAAQIAQAVDAYLKAGAVSVTLQAPLSGAGTGGDSVTDYGTDLRLAGDDIVFTADGDVEVVSGPAMVAQDIDQTLKAVPGSVYWDKEAGSVMPLFLNDSEADAASVIAELERAAIADLRVDPDSVKARQIAPGKFRLEFTPLAAIQPETLEYDLAKGRE